MQIWIRTQKGDIILLNHIYVYDNYVMGKTANEKDYELACYESEKEANHMRSEIWTTIEYNLHNNKGLSIDLFEGNSK